MTFKMINVKLHFQKSILNRSLIIRIAGFVMVSVVLIFFQFSLAKLILLLYAYIAIAWKLKSFITFGLGILFIILVVISLLFKKAVLADTLAMYGFLVLILGSFTAILETRKVKI